MPFRAPDWQCRGPALSLSKHVLSTFEGGGAPAVSASAYEPARAEALEACPEHRRRVRANGGAAPLKPKVTTIARPCGKFRANGECGEQALSLSEGGAPLPRARGCAPSFPPASVRLSVRPSRASGRTASLATRTRRSRCGSRTAPAHIEGLASMPLSPAGVVSAEGAKPPLPGARGRPRLRLYHTFPARSFTSKPLPGATRGVQRACPEPVEGGGSHFAGGGGVPRIWLYHPLPG